MKINKTLIILSLLLIFCISLGAVSATEDISVDTTDNSVDTVENTVNINDEINILSTEKINKSSEIYNEIKNATGTYNITTDYQIDKTWNIINNNVIIEGNNHTIYGNSKQAFNITSNNVTIKNLNFVDCFSEHSGGAIYWKHDSYYSRGIEGSVVNCSFVNCSAFSGGAIYDSSHVVNCSFVGCYAAGPDSDGPGGAIFSHLFGSVDGCSFVNCSAHDGGAIQVLGSVSDCSFVNCRALWGGGAIRSSDSVVNCSFVNCHAGSSGGAIYSPSSIIGCSFVNCSAQDGGAISWTSNSMWNVSIIGCSFVNCSATNNGGVIFLLLGDFHDSVVNCSFVNCSAGENGRAICGFVSIVNCSFYLKFNEEIKDILFDFSESELIKNGNKFIYDCLNVTLTPTALNTTYASGKYFQVKVVDTNQNPISGLKLTLKVYTGSSYQTVYVTTDANGIAKYGASKLSVGTHKVVVSLSNAKYVADSKTSSIKISKATVTITPTALSTTYDSGKYFQVKVVSKDKKAVVGLKLKLLVYTGKKYKTVYVTTGSDGVAKYSASKLSIAKHKVVVSSGESTKYLTATKKTSYITVKKATTSISAPVVKNKYGKTAYFKVTVKNKATGKVVKSLAIKIKVYTGKKYKTYTVKTNANGIAQLSTRYLAKGTHKVVISSGNSKYTVSKSGKLIVIK